MRVNLVGQSTRVFPKRVAKHSRLMQTYRRTNFGLSVKQRHGYKTFKASNHGYKLRLIRKRT
jgi:hypothetical protein